MTYTITAVTLGHLLASDDITIKRNAMSILKIMQKCDHKMEGGRCIYCFKPTAQQAEADQALAEQIREDE